MIEAQSVALTLGEVSKLEDLVDRGALSEVCRSFHSLFGLPIRVFSTTGAMLADIHEERAVCRYVNGTPGGSSACARTVGQVRELVPEGEGSVLHACFTGAVYRVVPIRYDGRQIGRFVIGPYLPADVREVPKSLLVIDDRIDPERAREALAEMPRVRAETADKIAQHLERVLDLILFSGHRAFLTTEMHLASVRESYREVAEKAERLEVAYEKLKELDRLKSNFLATISHELRTPLTSIIGYSEMLAAGIAGSLAPEQAEFVETIRSKSDQLLALISSLLDLSRLEQGHLSLKLESIDPRVLLTELDSTQAPTAKKKNITFETHVEGEVPEVRVDVVRFRQILINLSDNAMKFTPAGGTVSVTARVVDVAPSDGDDAGALFFSGPTKALEIAVKDTGIGIPLAEQDKIFNAFYQVDGSSTRAHGGAGLGLSIVKRLVDAHRGTIRVASEMGRGTTFFVTLPEAFATSAG